MERTARVSRRRALVVGSYVGIGVFRRRGYYTVERMRHSLLGRDVLMVTKRGDRAIQYFKDVPA